MACTEELLSRLPPKKMPKKTELRSSYKRMQDTKISSCRYSKKTKCAQIAFFFKCCTCLHNIPEVTGVMWPVSAYFVHRAERNYHLHKEQVYEE